jgi:hypothetical protein
MSKSKSVLVVSCTHVGHLGGLCGPGNWQSLDTKDPKLLLVGTLQRQVYKWWDKTICPLAPDVVVHVGDVIDGPQNKSGGEDLWTTRQEVQAEAAVELLGMLRKPRSKFYMAKGTRYHDPTNQEQAIANALNAECCEPQAFVDVNGVVFDCKHKVGGGGTPSGRPGMRNQMLHNLLWSRRGGQPPADIIVRGHLHDYYHEGDETYTGIVVPGVQFFSEWGQLNVSRPISIGCVFFPEVSKGMKAGDVSWHPLIAKLPALAPRVYKA